MTFSDEDLRLGLQAINLMAVVWLALSGRNLVKKEALDAKLGAHSDRLTALETSIKHGPTHDDLKRIHTRLDKVCEDFSALSGELKGKGHTLDLIHEFLLNESRK